MLKRWLSRANAQQRIVSAGTRLVRPYDDLVVTRLDVAISEPVWQALCERARFAVVEIDDELTSSRSCDGYSDRLTHAPNLGTNIDSGDGTVQISANDESRPLLA